MTVTTVKEAQRKLEELLDEAARGEEVVITTGDGRTFKLVSATAKLHKGGLIGSAKGQVWLADDFDAPLEDFEKYMW